MNGDNEIRVIVRTPEFDEYYNSQPPKVQEKYNYAMNLIAKQYVVSEKFIKKIETSDLYEIRVSVTGNEHRTLLFSLNDDNFMQSTKVLLLNSFLKKDTKQYRREIAKGNDILKRYLYG